MSKKLSLVLNEILIASGILLSRELKLLEMPVLYIVISVIGLIYLFFLVRDDGQKVWNFFRERYWPVRLLLLLAIWNLLMTIYYAISYTGNIESMGLSLSIFALAVIGIYIVIHGIDYNRGYLYLTLIIGILVSVFSFVFDYFKFEWISTILLLANMIATLLFLEARGKALQYIYLLCGIVTDILLNLNNNYLGITVLGTFYIAIPIVLINSKANIKKSGIMLMTLMLITSNMSLIPFCIEDSKIAVALSLEESIYLDVVIAVLSLLFFNYWDKLPEKVDENLLLLNRFRKGITLFGIGYVFTIVSILCAKDSILSFPEEGIKGGVKLLFIPLIQSLKSENMISYMIEQIDFVSLVLILLVLIGFLFFGYLRRKKYQSSINGIFLIAIVFVAEMAMWKMNSGMMAVNYIFILLASYSNTEQRNIKRIPLNIYNIREILGESMENADEVHI